jgi:two-component system NtrC family response regulator
MTQQPSGQASDEQIRFTIDQLLKQNLLDAARQLAKNAGIMDIRLASEETLDYLSKYITLDNDMLEVKRKCQILSNTDDIVCIIGETGTGKELLARSLHGSREGKFIAINCASIPDELIESEMFGHVIGSFTGAVKDRIGKFQAAFNGTLFLDEVGELPQAAQASLLRVLQERVITRVGGNEEIKVQCRVVCATWHNLEEEVKQKRFRDDLYYRLTRVVLKTKPLRERKVDLVKIAKHLDKQSKLTADDFNRIQQFQLHGNVRELENIIRRKELFGKVEE